ncbi:TetR/AcrR family transcriptional regulator [uncultured Desulfosarcina sp.]|uniref:TetR/AcrR family transcriptional regulator n=1 Tax=uncultured Desulfosarcina sp. TaxID=218289 RepID=UPI0029C8F53A|nr:TetR/AcrR family transcriptional regulator [uncultured Desulfosarcina sp.]
MKATQKKILAAAIAVFSRKGFHQATMDDIAGAAGVAKGTLYYNYDSKSALFSVAITDGIDEMIATVRDAMTSDLPFHQHLRKLVELNIGLYLKHSDLTRIVFNELTSGMDAGVLAEIEQTRQRYVAFMADQLRIGRDQGYLRPMDLDLAAVGLVGLVENLCAHHLKNPRRAPKEKIVETLYTLLSRGLCE